jgi:hypothetical protein
MEDKTKELFDKICTWEAEAGESFTDYFMHDHVTDASWAFWLVGKGYHERGNKIIDLIGAGERYFSQELLFLVNSSEIVENDADEIDPFNRELYEKDVMLWADFLTATTHYHNKITEWFKENGIENDEEE